MEQKTYVKYKKKYLKLGDDDMDVFSLSPQPNNASAAWNGDYEPRRGLKNNNFAQSWKQYIFNGDPVERCNSQKQTISDLNEILNYISSIEDGVIVRKLDSDKCRSDTYLHIARDNEWDQNADAIEIFNGASSTENRINLGECKGNILR